MPVLCERLLDLVEFVLAVHDHAQAPFVDLVGEPAENVAGRVARDRGRGESLGVGKASGAYGSAETSTPPSLTSGAIWSGSPARCTAASTPSGATVRTAASRSPSLKVGDCTGKPAKATPTAPNLLPRQDKLYSGANTSPGLSLMSGSRTPRGARNGGQIAHSRRDVRGGRLALGRLGILPVPEGRLSCPGLW